MKRNKLKGFTLVELLAVIVILAIILVIAVPKVMDVINDSKKASLETTVKMIAGQAEKKKIENDVLGKNETITCKSVAKYDEIDYADCNITFDGNTANVTIEGANKFEGLYVCNGTKTSTIVQEEKCTSEVSMRKLADDDWETIVTMVNQAYENGTKYPYKVRDTKTVDMGSLGVHTLRVANTTKCSEVTVESKTACGFVLEFADIITKQGMKGTNYQTSTNKKGWPASEMRTYVNNDIYNALPEKLRDGIIDTYVISSKGNETITGYENVVDGNFYSTDKLYLLSGEEVMAQINNNMLDYDTSRGTSRQLDYYVSNNVCTSNSAGAIKQYAGSEVSWWLRSAFSETYQTFL